MYIRKQEAYNHFITIVNNTVKMLKASLVVNIKVKYRFIS